MTEPELVSEVVRRSLANEWSPAALDVLVALFSAEAGDDSSDDPLFADDDSPAVDAGHDCAAHGYGCTHSATSIAPAPEWLSTEPISLVPRSKSEARRMAVLAGQPMPGIDTKKYGRPQRDPAKRYAETGSGPRPLCDVEGCDSQVRSRGRCRKHGG